MTIDQILDAIRAEAHSQRDKGDKFERLMVGYLQTDPIYVDRFDKVWMWAEWPHKTGPDTGIDLVARMKDSGEFVAIQCKCYDRFHTIQKSDIDSFFTASGQEFATPQGPKRFVERMIITTTGVEWSIHAKKAITAQDPPVRNVINFYELAQAPIDWSKFRPEQPDILTRTDVKQPMRHQAEAIASVAEGFKTNDRGKLIMACGTGKTLTGLRIAEQTANGTGLVLVLVPSISLLSQTHREWMNEAIRPFHAYAVCSDKTVGKKEKTEDLSPDDLVIPATTDERKLASAFHKRKQGEFTVIFSTYHSLKVVADAQRLGVPEADLVICDEAHRTTGVTGPEREDTAFVQIHDATYLKAKKRLYMTATPRVYAESAKAKAAENEYETYSMDDAATYGPEFYRLGFGKAVEQNLLSDYKVLVLAIREDHISRAVQKTLAGEAMELPLPDAAKIIGCWNGLSKYNLDPIHKVSDPAPMRRAVAFATTIKDSKAITKLFQSVVNEYATGDDDRDQKVSCELFHVDGTFDVMERNRLLRWLKQDPGEGKCRILSNARCLTEGVDVPDLDAVLFLKPRDSQVDVVQAVGRVMRRAIGKKYGYVILPVTVPAGTSPEEALNDNKNYKVVWQVLQALRAHDERFDAKINQIELNKKRPDQIQIIGVGFGERDSDKPPMESAARRDGPITPHLGFDQFDTWSEAIYAKMVLKCGKRQYWEQWASDVADIAGRHVTRLKTMVTANADAKAAFARFVNGLQQTINPAISEADAIEMLSQHLITKPVFDALFEGYEFSRKNPVSVAMDTVLTEIKADVLETELKSLEDFYASVKNRVQGIDNAEARQKVVIELYDKFFRLAFPRMAERLGIVYTPVEVVDFIVRSVDYALREHFDGTTLSDKNVHILDPFTGTGTFIVRLLQNGLIRQEDLQRKFREELHANEIVLLAYYIAGVNIESAYHDLVAGAPAPSPASSGTPAASLAEPKTRADGAVGVPTAYEPFQGIVLTDTFQIGEGGERSTTTKDAFGINNDRVARQKARDIRVIIGNPPYSALQESENDNNQNLDYPALDARIRGTYAARSTVTNKNSLYDSYIRAIRWASDRIGASGVVGFVTNGGFIDSNSADGLRKCLADEFSHIYCFNLRGNQRTSGERSRQEGGKIFGSGSRTPVAITILVKNPVGEASSRPSEKARNTGGKDASPTCTIHYHDIGDYLTREDKLKIVSDFGSIESLQWTELEPNDEGDWISQRDPDFERFVAIGEKNSSSTEKLFSIHSLGAKTNRDAWAYNFGSSSLNNSMKAMLATYAEEMERYKRAASRATAGTKPKLEDIVSNDEKKISWSGGLKDLAKSGRPLLFRDEAIVPSLYRPFSRMFLYFDGDLVERTYQLPKLFPTPRHTNILISATGIGASKSFSAIVTDLIPNLHLHDTGQCFPRYWYEHVGRAEKDKARGRMDFGSPAPDDDGYIKHDAITDWALSAFHKHYATKKITKDDIFWYVYGLLHSPEYRERYATSLSKMLPRIPFAKDFWAFSTAGKQLGDLHLNYETIEPWPLEERGVDTPVHHERSDPATTGRSATARHSRAATKGGKDTTPTDLYRVEKMKFAGKHREPDKSTIIYNQHVTLSGIPAEAHEYIVNGKSALDWVMERYAVKTDKDSGIVNDPNEYSDDPRYIIDLVKRVVRVSIETVKIVKSLPELGV